MLIYVLLSHWLYEAFVGHCVEDVIKILTGPSLWLSSVSPAWSRKEQRVPFLLREHSVPREFEVEQESVSVFPLSI